jgi:hypothetical protein
MKKLFLEALFAVIFVVGGTALVYSRLSSVPLFWNEQTSWSLVLIICWMVVAIGYFHQGWIIHTSKSSANVSIALPIAVFIVQCILFVKGIYYHDWSLIGGAIIVNSGVTFNLYHIIKTRLK